MAMVMNHTNCVLSPPTIPSIHSYYHILLPILPSFMTLFTIIGNTFVLVAIRLNKRLAKKHTSILIFNLALADLLVGSIVMPLSVSQIANENRWIFGRTLCRLWTAMDVICSTASIFTLCIISVDRWIGVTRPLSYSYIVTRGRLWSAVVLVWLLSIAVLLITVQWKGNECVDVHVCRVGNELQYVVHSVIMSFFVPLIVILFVHYKIYQVTQRREISLLHYMPRRNRRQPRKWFSCITDYCHKVASSPITERRNTLDGDSGQHSQRRRGKQSRRNRDTLRVHYGGYEDELAKQRKCYSKHKKAAKTLALVVGAFLFCWLPFFVVYLISSTCENDCIPAALLESFTWLGYTNSALNPIIYAISMNAFGNDVRQTFNHVARLCCNHKPTFIRTRRRSSLSSAVLTAPATECTPANSPSLYTTQHCVRKTRFSSTSSSSTSATTKGPFRTASVTTMKGPFIGTVARLEGRKCLIRPNTVIPEKPRHSVLRQDSRRDCAGQTKFVPQSWPSINDCDQSDCCEEDVFYIRSFGPRSEDDSELETVAGIAVLVHDG